MDLLILLLSYFLAWFIKIGSPWSGVTPHNQQAMAPVYLAVIALIIPFHLILYLYYRLYNQRTAEADRKENKNIVKANLVCLLIAALIFYLYGKRQPFYDFSRSMILLYFIFNTLLSLGSYSGIRLTLRFLYSKDCNQTHVLLVGYSQATEDFIDRIRSNAAWGYEIHGILDDHKKPGDSYRSIPVIGPLSDLEEQLKRGELNEAAITLPLDDYGKIENIVRSCEKSGVHTKFIPDYKNIIPTIPDIEDLDGLPVIHIRRLPLSNFFSRFAKRLLDLFGAVICLVLLSPVLLFTALKIRLTSQGALIDRRECLGMHGRTFRTCHFRMPKAQSDSAGVLQSFIADLPLLFNVLKGDLSFVGPRPVCPLTANQEKKESPRYMVRFQVRPGLTGWSQIHNSRSHPLPPERQTARDLYYIENWTLLLDCKILLRTIFTSFFRRQ